MASCPVLFETVWDSVHDGWATASRAYTRAMAEAGIDVRLTSWMEVQYPLHDAVQAQVGHLQVTEEWAAKYRAARASSGAVYIFSTAFGGEEQMIEPLRRLRDLSMPPRMLYTMFERSNVSESLAKRLNALDGVWVPSNANRGALEAAGCHNATWIPYPYFDDDPHLQIPLLRELKTFYWIGRWEPRKAPDNLIRAFLRAFKPGESKLVLKLGPHKWSMIQGCFFEEPESVINGELMQDAVAENGWNTSNVYSDIELLKGTHSPQEMVELHARCDIYISASRGEGIDLPAHAAKLAGRRLVTTNSGGPIDFIGEGDILVSSTGSIPAPEYAWLWGPDGQYNDYELEALVKAMQRARESGQPKRLPPRFRSSLVGALLKEWIEKRCPQ